MQERLSEAIEDGDLKGLHSVVMMLNGERRAEAYFPGKDENWGLDLGLVQHGPDSLHDTRSVTKSIVGLLYGIALAEKAVPELNTPLLNLFPEYPDLRDGSDREKITIRDALTMQMGTEWDESLPYTDPRNSEHAMELAKDRYRFILDRPMTDKPGTTWSYNGGAVALLGKLITDGTGMPLEEYANSRLFKPLDIETYEWVKGYDGVSSAASGLRLTARDLAKIGMMVAQDGVYEGQKIVPFEWLKASSQPASLIQEGFEYGYLWYLIKGPSGDTIMIALGNGGQRLTVQPERDFVVSTFAGNYNQPDAWQVSLKVLLEFAIPEATKYLKNKD
ncbi:serine hydrolase domain-containing protein [Curvivirga sp.]|uniref:serine hydrolase domain-containing protein n=1 Tax=Curvivirga sp. TaxID=2856848 RepID=UPI003B5C17D4